MKKFEVRTVYVETKFGRDTLEKFHNQTNQTTELVKAFDTLEDAKEYYAHVYSGVRYMGGYYLHSCKLIEENDYDEDGEWVDGGLVWTHDFPDSED